MEAIPTNYKNIRFRSKLEASYALTFDSYGIEWAYEVNGFQIDSIKYLPDFWLPKIHTVLEVKGPLVPGAEKTKALAGAVNNPDWWNPQTLVVIGNEMGVIKDAENDTDVSLAKCTKCKQFWFMPWYLSFACRNCNEYDGDHHIEKTYERFELKQFHI
ncbi:MAG: hypothetical protein IPP35_07080 [Elusimicrobia bacterium]|nr:hypothetical protein [Elusimicrobiota bacterium]